MICKKCQESIQQDGLELCPKCGEKLALESETVTPDITPEVEVTDNKMEETKEVSQPNAEETKPETENESKSEDTVAVKAEKPTKKSSKKAPKEKKSDKEAVSKEKKGNNAGLWILVGVVSVLIVAAILFSILFFTGIIKIRGVDLPVGGSLKPQTSMEAANNSANTGVFIQAGKKVYCNYLMETNYDTGIYNVPLNGSEPTIFAKGEFNQIVPIGSKIVANNIRDMQSTDKFGGSLVVYDTKLNYADGSNKPVEIFSGNAYGLRVFGDNCYFSEYSDEDKKCNGIYRYNAPTGKIDKVYDGVVQDYAVYDTKIVFFVYSEEEETCKLSLLDTAVGGEPKELPSFDLLMSVFQLTEDSIYFSRIENEETAMISRMDYDGNNLKDVYQTPLDDTLYQIGYYVDDEGITLGQINLDASTGAPIATVEQCDKDGNVSQVLFSDMWYRLSKLGGNYFYISLDTATGESIYTVRMSKDIDNGIHILYDESAASNNVSSEPVSLEPVPDGLLHEDYDPTVQLEEPKNGDEIAKITTSEGVITIRFFEKQAPKAVENFKGLAKKGFYDGLTFHRVSNGFMIQGGDPKGDGTGGESIYGKPFEDEFDKDLLNIRGAVAMANSGANTNLSQFFIDQAKPEDVPNWDEWVNGQEAYEQSIGYRTEYQPKRIPDSVREQYTKLGGVPELDGAYRSSGGHTVFGQVIDGMDVVDAIATLEDVEGGMQAPSKKVTIEKVEIVKYKK